MSDGPDYLITGAGGSIGGVSSTVVELLLRDGASVRAMVHRDGEHADALRALGAHVVVGDLTDPGDVVAAMQGVKRMFFNMSVSSSYLNAAAIICAAGRESGGLERLVNMSQMTVSQMTLTSTEESTQHRLHWLTEQVMDWSGLPVTHVRPTVFIDNPLFTFLNAASVREQHKLVLPFGAGRTSPIAASDVARVVAALLHDPHDPQRHVYELTGPALLDIADLTRSFSEALGYSITGVDIPLDEWAREILRPAGLPPHVEQHIATMARLHRADRYNRLTHQVEEVTGEPALTVTQYIAAQPGKFGG